MNHQTASVKGSVARRRRVRLGYPAAFVELALVLSDRLGTREAASMLDLNLGTLYRWMGNNRNVRAPLAMSHRGRPMRAVDILTAGCPPHVADQPATRASMLLRSADRRETTASDAMRSAKMQIDANYARKASCTSMASAVNLPRIRFIKEFRSTFGISPYQYLIGVRVRHARRLLENSAQPLPEVAASTGFGSAASMQRAFRRFLGASPAKAMNTIFSPAAALPPNDPDRFQSA